MISAMAPRTRLAVGLIMLIGLVLAGCASAPVEPPGPTVEEKLTRLLRLEDERSTGDGEVQARLADEAGRVRAKAAVSLARIGDVGAEASIVPLLTDRTDFVRASAAFALGILEGELRPETLSALEVTLADADELVRGRVMETLGKKGGEPAAEAIAITLSETAPRGAEPYNWAEDMEMSSLAYPHHDLRLGIIALARMETLRWSWGVLASQGSTPRYVWWPAAWATSYLDGEERAPLVRYYAGSQNPEFRLWGARGYASLRAAEGVREYIRLMLADPNEWVRIAAVRASATLYITEVVPDLIRMLDNDTRYVQAVVLEALAAMSAPSSIEPLVDRLGSDSRWIRALTLPALARQDADGFWLLLSGLGSDPAWEVRASLADLLGRMTGSRPIELLRNLAEESQPRVRERALTSLALRDAEGAPPILIRHLSAPDPFERLAAAKALARLGTTDAAAPIEQAFLVEGDEVPRVKAELLRALYTLSPERAQSVASDALDEPSYLVRREATAIVNRHAAENGAVSIRSRSSELALSIYRPLIDPPYTPQAFIRLAGGGVIELELFVADAPLTVQNFIQLARRGFYDGLTFHDVVPNGFIVGGDPRGDGNGGPGYTVRSEINERAIVRGSLVMADHGKDTAGSQFFITHLPHPHLDGRHTVFGRVSAGMPAVDKVEPGQVIESVTIWDGFESPYR